MSARAACWLLVQLGRTHARPMRAAMLSGRGRISWMPPSVFRTFTAAILALAPVGCTSSSSSSSSPPQRPPTSGDQRIAEAMAAGEWQMRQYQQQPRSNRQYEKLVHPQPVEDPLHADRDLPR